MNRSQLLQVVLPVALFCGATVLPAQTTVLSDSFTSDSLNPATYVDPTSSATTWDTIGNKTTVTSSLSSGLTLGTVSTGSVIEAAALFTTSPITLSASGDYVKLTYTFSGTGIAASNGYLLTGLYNSGSTTPLTGLTNYTAATNSGGVAGWTGYNAGVGVVSTSSSSKMFARPAEADLVAGNQDLLYGGLGAAYANPVQIAGANSTRAALADSTTYTFTYELSLDASLNSVVSYNLYSGASEAGTLLLSNSGTQSTGTVTHVFDAFALGFYNKANASGSSITYSNVSVSTNVPEPSTYALIAGVAVLALVTLRRRSVTPVS